ncbi:MAG: flap endonuclease-1 [Methanomicrobiales archaeon]|nr:flap endonuclease-1 [Methanomicrobiales archaeon]
MGVAIRELLVDYKKSVDWDSLQGIAAVDAHNALYQFLTIIRQPDGTPLMDAQGRITSHLSGILFRTLNLVEMGIKPVYIFDGPPPHFKRDTVQKRHAVRVEAKDRWQEARERGDTAEAYKQARSSATIDRFVIDSSRQLLGLLGIPWVQAPSEGEAQAAFMVREGDATYVVSQDLDALLFGTPVLVRNVTISGKRRVRGRSVTIAPERISLKEVLDGLGITREQLVQIGILVGTDFNTGIRGVGPKTALRTVKNGEFQTMITKEPMDPGADEILQFFLDPPVMRDYTLHWSPPDPDGVLQMLVAGFNFSPERVESALEKLRVRSGQKTLDRWF